MSLTMMESLTLGELAEDVAALLAEVKEINRKGRIPASSETVAVGPHGVSRTMTTSGGPVSELRGQEILDRASKGARRIRLKRRIVADGDLKPGEFVIECLPEQELSCLKRESLWKRRALEAEKALAETEAMLADALIDGWKAEQKRDDAERAIVQWRRLVEFWRERVEKAEQEVIKAHEEIHRLEREAGLARHGESVATSQLSSVAKKLGTASDPEQCGGWCMALFAEEEIERREREATRGERAARIMDDMSEQHKDGKLMPSAVARILASWRSDRAA